MTRYLRIVTIASCLGAAGAPLSAAQDAPAPAPAPGQQKSAAPAERPNPVQVEVVISRYRNDKKIAAMPYLVSAPVNQGVGRLQVGGQVPVPAAGGQGAMQYRNVGTSIDVTVKSTSDGRYEVSTNVSDSAVAGAADALNVTPGVAPVLKTYTSMSYLILRDGQTAQFNAATDPISGETVRVDVTLRVAK